MIKLCCLKCNGNNFSARAIELKHKDKYFKSVAWVCDDCSTPLMDSNQMDQALDETNKIEKKTFDPIDQDKKRINRINQNWSKRTERKQSKKHPWKIKIFKNPIDNHVLSQ